MSHVRTMDEYRQVLGDILSLTGDDVLAVDTETTSLRPWLDAELRGVSVAYRGREGGVYIPVSHPDSANFPAGPLFEAISRSWLDKTIWHNCKYDWAVIERNLGVKPPSGVQSFWDTCTVDWLVDENQRHGLKAIASRLWGEDEAAEQRALKQLFRGETQAEVYKRLRLELAEAGVKEPAAVTKERARELSLGSKRAWADLRVEELSAYAAQDAALTKRLYEHQLADPDFAHVAVAVDRELAVQEVVYRMERLGVQVDPAKIHATRAANLRRADEIAGQFDIQLGSSQQLAKLIYGEWGLPVHEHTDTGAPSTSKSALEPLAGAHPGLDLILEWRSLTKAVSTYYDALLDNADESDRVHCSFNTTGTVTGRFSSSGPNMQNIPRGGTNPEVKAVFTAAPGYELWSYDLKSAELFVAASITRDERMIAALIEDGRDFHSETAMAVFGTVDERTRTLAKNLNYGVPYGIGPTKMAKYFVAGTGQMVEQRHINQARAALDKHRSTWKGLHKGIRTLADYAEMHGRVPLHAAGRYRHFNPQGLFPVPTFHAINAVVQGGVAEFMKTMMLVMAKPADALGARLVLQVHDSLVYEVPTGAHEELQRRIQALADLTNPFRGVPMIFDGKPGL